MQLNLGNKIRELRRRDGRTQENVADALGVTSQAVSRWESGGSYPDMEAMPALANYFGVTIDELFGYHNDRENKIDAIVRRIEEFDLKRDGSDRWVDDCLTILRQGLAEFPGNERLLITLAETLWHAGWRRNKEWIGYDENGFIQYCYDRQHQNEYWSEADKICNRLIESSKDHTVFARAIAILVPLYRIYGEYEKAISYAGRMPDMCQSREFLLTEATDGKRQAAYIDELLLKMAKEFAEQLIYGLITDLGNFDTDMPVTKVQGAIGIFHLLCDDGKMGAYHDFVAKLYLYLSRLQWERGYRDEAFESLELALEHAKAMKAACDVGSMEDIARRLPEDWPFWGNPDYTKVAEEIKADPRWDEWVMKTQE